ncbi:hypothetical protein HGM15179_012957 [Zosterops borbonicus]|uniref:Uncharacterized protein n=1 Tax=Zosterops borbonicus TaxID=364589 RepID=A0A8K1G8X2_9PASS|nr:hypothetical protein HGM15179_012957 [Zosterops borbonicus]
MTMNQPLHSPYCWENLVKTRQTTIQYLQLEAFHLHQWMLDQAIKYPVLRQESLNLSILHVQLVDLAMLLSPKSMTFVLENKTKESEKFSHETTKSPRFNETFKIVKFNYQANNAITTPKLYPKSPPTDAS